MRKKKVISGALALVCAVNGSGVTAIAAPSENDLTVSETEFNDDVDVSNGAMYTIDDEKADIQPQTLENTLRVVVSGDDGNVIEGARFELFKDGESQGEYTTNSSGIINITRTFGIGHYYFKILSADGYAFDPEKEYLSFNIESENVMFDPSDPFTMTMAKKVSSTFDYTTITVYDDQDEPIVNAVVKLLKGGVLVSEGQTDANGNVKFTGLTEGDYTITAEKEGFQALQSEFTLVQSNWYTQIELQMVESLAGRTLTVQVIDQETGNAVSGAVLEIYKDDGTFVEETETNENGEAVFTKIDGLSYVIKEKTMPSGYAVNKDGYTFSFSSESASGKFTIKKLAAPVEDGVTLTFRDKSTGSLLSGIELQVISKSTEEVVQTLTDESGYIKIPEINAEDHYLKIIKLPSGYIGLNAMLDVPTENTYVELESSSAITSGRISLKMMDSDQNPVSGVTVQVTNADGYNETVTTSDDGTAVLTDLAFGTYTWKVLSVPAGYLEPSQSYEVSISEDRPYVNTGFLLTAESATVPTTIKFTENGNESVKLSGVKGSLYTSDGQTKLCDFTSEDGECLIGSFAPGNYKVHIDSVPSGYSVPNDFQMEIKAGTSYRFTIKLNKAAESYNLTMAVKDEKTGVVVPGVKLHFMTESGDDLGNFISDESGNIVISGIQEQDIKWTVVSVPDSYYLSTSTYTMSFTGGYGNYKSEFKISAKENVTGEISFTVKDNNDDVVPGVTIRLEDENGNVFERETDENGNILFNSLPIGTYTYSFVKVPTTHVKPTASNQIEVTGTHVDFTYTINKKVVATTTTWKFKFVDYDDNTKVIPGFTIAVYHDDGTLVKVATTGNDGIAAIDGLAIGSYYCLYLDAPEGYKDCISDKKHTFQVEKIVLTNAKVKLKKDIEVNGTFDFTITDIESEEPVPGVVVAVTKPDGTTENVTTDEEGKITLSDLKEGEYSYQIVSVPEAYYDTDKEGSFTLTKTMQEFTASMKIQKVSGMSLVQVREKDGKALTPVVVILTDAAGNIDRVTTDTNGTVKFNDLAAGTYTVTLEGVPEEYQDAGSRQLVISKEQTAVTVTFELEKKNGTATIEVSNSEKPDVTISVYKANGELVLTSRTEGGKLVLSDLKYGNYYYVVDEVPDVYESVLESQPFTVGTGDNTIEFELKKVECEFEISIKDDKEDFVSGKSVITLRNTVTGETEEKEVENGIGTFAVAPGTYEVSLVSVPDGYSGEFTRSFTVNKSIRKFTLTTVVAKKMYGNVTINVRDTDGNVLSGVSYKLTNAETGEEVSGMTAQDESHVTLEYGSYGIEITTPDGYRLTGSYPTTIAVHKAESEAVFTLEKIVKGKLTVLVKGSDETVLDNVELTITGPDGATYTKTTDEDGNATLDELDAGDYLVTINGAPEGYYTDSRSFPVTIKKDQTSATVEITLAKIEKEETNCDIEITLKESGSDLPVSGTVKLIKTGESEEEIGTYVFADGSCVIKGIKEGTYRYVVSVDSEYVEISEGTFTIEENQTKQTINLSTVRKMGAVLVTAVDDENDRLVDGMAITVDGEDHQLTNGQKSIALSYGDHTIEIKEVPEGYTLEGETSYTITVNTETSELKVSLKQKNGSASIVVKDSYTGEKIEAGTIIVYDKDKKAVASGSMSESGAVFEGLMPGDYFFTVTPYNAIYQGTEIYHEITINADTNTQAEVNMERKTGEILFSLVDEDGDPVPGTVITLVSELSANGGKTITFDENGLASAADMVYDSYSYTVDLPEGYVGSAGGFLVLGSAKTEITLKAQKVVPVDGSVVVIFKDADENPVKNIPVEVTNKATGNVTTLITDENGEIKLEGMDKGIYQFRGSRQDGNTKVSFDVEVDTSDVSSVNVTVSRTPVITSGTVAATVKDQDENPVSGANIGIYDQNGTLIRTVKTDANGQIKETLDLGSYQIGIISVDGDTEYVFSEEKRDFELSEKLTSFSMTYNVISIPAVQASGTVAANVKDQDGNPVKGVNIGIYDQDGTLIKTVKTDANGQIMETLDLGNYQIGVVSVDGDTEYVFSEEKKDFELSEKITSFTMNYTIVSVPAEQKNTVELTVKDSDENPLSGITVEIYDGSGNLVERTTTDANGKVQSELPSGEYEFKICKDDKNITEDKIITVEVSGTGETTIPVDITINKTPAVTSGTVTANVKDQDGNPVSGVNVGIYDQSGVLVKTVKTDANGQINATLDLGSYQIGIISVDGDTEYVFSEEKRNFELSERVTSFTMTYNVISVPAEQKNTVELTVKDSDGNPLSDVTVEVYNKDGNLVETITTNEDGKIKSELPAGEYEFKICKDGVNVLEDTTVSVKISGTGSSTLPLDVTVNKAPVITSGTVMASVKDQDGKPVKEANIAIYDRDGNLVKTVKTDAAGQIKETMVLGSYQIKIVSVDGDMAYVLPEDKKSFELSEKITSFSMAYTVISVPADQKNPVELTVKDKNGNPVSGATVEIYDENGKLVDKTTTNKDGKVETELPSGRYEFKICKDDENVAEDTVVSVEISGTGSSKLPVDVAVETKEDEKTKTGTIVIKVVDVDTKAAIANAVVSVNGKEYRTGSNGTVSASNLPYGSYVVKVVSADGYVVPDAMTLNLTTDSLTFTIQAKKNTSGGNTETPTNPGNSGNTGDNSGSGNTGNEGPGNTNNPGNTGSEKPSTGSKPGVVTGGFSGNTGSGSSSGSGSSAGGNSSVAGGPGTVAINQAKGLVGEWKYDAGIDKWTLNNQAYRNTWVYAFNGYATEEQGQNDWFYFDADGMMKTGWLVAPDGNTYYLNENSDGTRGKMLTGWHWINGRCYYFNEVSDGTKGKLLRNTTTPDGYQVDADGAWTINGVAVVR